MYFPAFTLEKLQFLCVQTARGRPRDKVAIFYLDGAPQTRGGEREGNTQTSSYTNETDYTY